MSILKKVGNLIKGAMGSREASDPGDLEDLRAQFKARVHAFKLLIKANNKALEIMSDMEAALRGSRVFGMSFVRANATAVLVNVFRLVHSLSELAPGRYEVLHERLAAIRAGIEDLLSARPDIRQDDRLVLRFADLDKSHSDLTGSKMANLGEIMNVLGLPVPNGFVVTAAGYRLFMEAGDLQAEIDRMLQTQDEDSLDGLFQLSSDIQRLIIRSEVPEELARAVTEAYEELSGGQSGLAVSLRSSALGEDAAGASFAGQFRSVLNVGPDHLLGAYREVVASKYSLPAMTYRLNRGIRDEDVAMCVGCMRMLDATSGGVMYSRNPMDGRDDAISIASVWGLAKSVVDGTIPSDLFVVRRGPPMAVARREIKDKDAKYVCDAGEGVCREESTQAERSEPSLTDDQILALASMAVRLEEHYGSPQDIEWAVGRRGNIYLLQCRPLQQLEPARGEMAPAPETGTVAGTDEGLLARGGVTASPGAASGPVFVARKELDALRFPDGAVLVTAQALPRWASLLSRAAAVVSEQGSVTGHLANVAREFRVPALFDVGSATTALAEGEVVTVDADGRRIARGRVEPLLAGAVRRGNIMQGSPVYETLDAVGRLIIPLSLLDPAAPEFRPESCRTLHDITRFVHEKSVQEMFGFGGDQDVTRGVAKQLVFKKRPMQWWIVDLGDAFREPAEGNRVAFENIDSPPMLAIWEGICAVPWAGPPAPSGKGMMSVFMEASMNPELSGSGQSSFESRSYFMVSRNYSCLNTRIGFHFTTIEALVGDDASENYVSFRYSGGAADEARRALRASFIAEILEGHGFLAAIKGDILSARIEQRGPDYMLARLKLLGYLLIHTRQIDMVMTDTATVRSLRAKIDTDLARLL